MTKQEIRVRVNEYQKRSIGLKKKVLLFVASLFYVKVRTQLPRGYRTSPKMLGVFILAFHNSTLGFSKFIIGCIFTSLKNGLLRL